MINIYPYIQVLIMYLNYAKVISILIFIVVYKVK